MKLAVHKILRGKPNKVVPLRGAPYMEYRGQRINLGYDWMNIDVAWSDAFELITTDGCASSAELQSNHRDDENFVSRQLIFVDIDSGMTIPELLANDFYNEHGAGFYTTPSHTWDNHRFRIMFVTETPIHDSERVRRLTVALMRVFDHADPACKDSTRIFYGTINAEVKEFRQQVLSDAMVDVLVEMEDMFRQQSAPPNTGIVNTQDYEPKTVEQIVDLLNELQRHYGLLEYAQRRDLTWALLSGGIAGPDVVAMLRARWNDTDLTGKYETFVRDHKNNNITLGTVYHWIRQHNPGYGRAPQAEQIVFKERKY